MKFSALRTHMTTTSLIFIFCLFCSFNSFSTTGKRGCGENKFHSELISLEQDGECLIYHVEVSLEGKCAYDLSHYNIDPGCGMITDAENSEGWKMELNSKDYKTGLRGLKVDDIYGFGKRGKKTFTVTFRFCPDGSCEEEPDCISPKVAYKAGQCVYYEELEVTCTNPLYTDVSISNPICHDGSNGSIALTIEGGTAPYEVTWSDGSTGTELNDVPAGEYIYTVKDSLGETFSDTVELNAPEAISLISELSNPTCSGSANGSISINATGGTSPYSYSWNNGNTTSEIGDLTAGEYLLTVTDANGCIATSSYTLENSSQILLSETITQPGCGDSSPGSIELEVSGGTSPYSFAWSDNVTDQNRYDLSAQELNVTVTDAEGCSISKSYTLEAQSDINLSTNVTHTTCNNDPVGEIDLFVSGGTAPYTFEWSNGATTEDLTELTAGKYAVVVTDANGCQAEYESNINQNEIVLYARTTSPSCPGESDASADLSVFFATGEYTVEWSNGATTEDLTDISAGDYTVTVTDELGCTASRYVQVSEPAGVQVNYDVVPLGCEENLTYEVQLNPTGGSGAYTYSWETGGTEATEIFDVSGTYSVTVTDENGCAVTEDILVEGEANSPTCLINDNGTTTPQCSTDGHTLSTSIEGAVSYQWSVQSSDDSWQITSGTDANQITYFTGNEGSNATFFLEVLLENGCTATCLYTVNTCTTETDPDNPDDGGTDPDNPDDGGTNPDNPDDGGTDPDNPDDGSEDGSDDGTDDSGGSDDGDGSDNGDDDNDNSDGGDGDNNDEDNPDDGDNDNPDNGDDSDDSDNPDDGDDNGDDSDQPGEDDDDKSCDECFYTNEIEIVKNGHYYEYTVTVNHNGNCNYDLSHFVIEIPECAYIKDYTNSEGWKMTKVYNDRKTGLTGIKVDDIPSFGKDDQFGSFEVYFTLKSYDWDCKESLACFEPTLAYKAGQCVQYEQAVSDCADNQETDDVFCKTYPNPTTDWVKVHFDKKHKDTEYTIDVHNYQGYRVNSYKIRSGRDKEFDINLSKYDGTLFFLNVKGTDGSHKTFRILKQ